MHRLRPSLVCLCAAVVCQMSLLSLRAQEAAPAADPAVLAKVDATEKVFAEVQTRKMAAEKVVAEAQTRLKAAAQQVAKAKADTAKATGELAPIDKMLAEKVAVVTKATEDAKPVVKAYTDAQAAEKVTVDAKAAADKLVVDSAAIAKAVVDTAAAAKAAAEKAPGHQGIAELKALADKVTAATAVEAQAAVTKAATAATAVTAAAAATKAANEKLVAAQKVITDAQAAATAIEPMVAAAKAKIAAATEVVKQMEAALAVVQTEVNTHATALAAIDTESTSALKAHEEALGGAGKLVLFSKQVAPVFIKRCLACHNAQTAKGRYNMDSYVGVMKGGEQGDTLIPKDADTSNLIAMIEDGTMPKDADPLTKDEIAAVKQWVLNGARLDAGLKPEAQLVTIVPKLPQPAAPESYRVPVPITAVAWSPDGNTLASSGYHEVILWNPNDGALIRRITNVAERTHDLKFNADGTLLAVASGTPGQMGEVKLFNPTDGTLVRDLMTTNDAVFGVAFSPDGKKLATCSADRSIRIFDMATFAQERLIEDHADWVMDIAWSPDGAKLASASRDKTSKVFDAKTGESLVTFPGHSEVVYGVAFSPDGTQVLTSGRDNRVRAWNPTNAAQVREIGGFGGEVYRVVVTPDGRLFTCSADKTAREHKVADGAAVRSFAGHQDWIYSVAFNPATKRLATGSWDGEVRVWNAEDAKGMTTFVAAPGFKSPMTAAK